MSDIVFMNTQFINFYFRPCPCSRCNGEKTLHTRTIRRHMKSAEIVTAAKEFPQILTNVTWDNVHDSAISVPPVTDATDAMDATDDLHTSLPIPADQPLNLDFNIPNFQHTSSDDALVTENAPSSIPESTLDDVNNSLLPEDIIADDLDSVSIVSLSNTTTASSTDDKDLECRRRLYLWSTRFPISRVAKNDLLALLRDVAFPNLPLDWRTLENGQKADRLLSNVYSQKPLVHDYVVAVCGIVSCFGSTLMPSPLRHRAVTATCRQSIVAYKIAVIHVSLLNPWVKDQ